MKDLKILRSAIAVVVTVLGTMNRADATSVIDQQQAIIDGSVGGLVIGGASTQQLAQVVTAGVTGLLTEVRFPVACDAGSNLVIEIQDVTGGTPNGVVLTSQTILGTSLPSSGARFRSLALSTPVAFTAGSQFAIVLKSTGACGVFQGPVGDSYPGGNLYFDALPNRSGWVCVCSFPGDRFDLPFHTLVPGFRIPGDFDGDGKTDPAVFRPATGSWYVLKSSTSFASSAGISWGLATDLPVPGDFDGDGKTDFAVFRPSIALWAILKSSTNYTTATYVSWGLGTDVPAPGDYDGDGKADPGVYRPSTGSWFYLESSTNYMTSIGVSWGLSTDVPVQGDYDGDGKADPAIYRPSTGLWAVLKSSTNYTTATYVSWGLSTDLAVPGDYDGDGKIDPAVFRPSTGGWYILQSATGYSTSAGVTWGLSTDVPVPADFDGDGKTDPAIYRPSTGLWAALNSSTDDTSSLYASWGLSTDTPINKRP